MSSNGNKYGSVEEPKNDDARKKDEEESGMSGSDTERIDEEALSMNYSQSKAMTDSSHLHMLTSYRPGESKVEKLAQKIEDRVEQRIPVTFNARKEFLKTCRFIAQQKGYEKLSRVKYADILEYRQQVKEEAENNDAEGIFSRFLHWIGVLNDKQCLRQILDKAQNVATNIDLEDHDWFFYQDFNFFHTVLVSRWPWMRNDLLFAFGLVFLFYLCTPILFCAITKDEGVCPSDPRVPGWVSALYFASTTMSTVGYGDLTVSKNEVWRVFIGACYMVVALLVAIIAFSAAAESAMSPIKGFLLRFSPVHYPEGPLKDGEYLYQRIRQVKSVMIMDIAIQFTFLNLIGIFASQIFVLTAEAEARQWGWMTSIYWAIQTTTTIGYGDLSMPHYMRWFQIFYLTLGAYFTGNALGRFGTMKDELEEIRRYHAWERREINKHMMHYLASTEDPTRVDQYEFVIASLMNLGKIKVSDVEPIMDKFRTLAKNSGHSGYIKVENVPEEIDIAEDDAKLEEVEGNEGS